MSKAITAAPKVPKKVAESLTRPTQVLFSKKDFIILCPSAADSVLAQAALYFLPANYKLRVLVETFRDIMPLSDDQTIVERISFGSKAELSDMASASHHAILYAEESSEIPQSPSRRVLISKQTDSLIEDRKQGTFTVAFDSPEAVASAMLRIARAQTA